MPHIDRRSADRRVGERVHASLPIEITVSRGWSNVTLPASIVDVSISGCRLFAHLSPELVVGTDITLTTEGREGSGVIRRSEVGGIPGKAFFGVEFTFLDEAFRALLFQTISDGLRAVPSR